MNDYAMGRYPQEDGYPRLSPPAPGAANGKAMFEGYRKDILNGFEGEAPRYNPLNAERTQSSALVDLKDPIQVHLLTETALSDSKQYEVLSQEEVDGLKKQCQQLTKRIESTRTNLTIQSKYRDAAISMAKLYSPGKSDSKRRSLLNRNSGDQSVRDAQVERVACERKCEELAAELFNLEKRLMEPQRRLLEHTAGILQLTHKVSKRKQNAAQQGHLVNGIPGSPESLYTYSQSRNSLDPSADDGGFDDGMYPLDHQSRKNAIEIPMKSPVREQHHQLREEMDRVREEKSALMSSVSEMERKLEELNASLRETIIRFDPEGNSEFLDPPSASTVRQLKPGDLLRSQVGYLESGLVAIQAEQEVLSGISRTKDNGETEQVQLALWDKIQSGLAAAKQRKDDRRRARSEKGLEDDEEMSDDDGIDVTEPYSLIGFDSRIRWLNSQATTLKDQKSVLKRQIKQQRELNNKSDAEKDDELRRKEEELDQNKMIADRAEKDAMDAQKLLSEALQDLEEARAAAADSSRLQGRAAEADALEAQVRELEAIRTQFDTATQSRAAAEQGVQDLQRQLADKDTALSTNQKALKAKEEEMEQLSISLAELKTEVTIARAELDGAYGSRAERAADVAALKSSGENDRLRDELTATVKELEEITKETIAAEREKVDLEGKLDDALAARTSLEAEVNRSRERIHKLQEDLDGERLKAHPGSGGASKPSAGASMLSEQFRATMREERKKYQEDIREERTKNHKLEEELARLKRAQGPGKSPLSPR